MSGSTRKMLIRLFPFDVVAHSGRSGGENRVSETSQRTTRYIWPTEAERLVKRAAQSGASQRNAALLHQKLLALTGFSDHACWRYLQKFGIKRPGAGKRVQWNPKAVDFVMDQGYDAAVQKFNTSKKAVYRFMQRNERVLGACRGQYSLNQLRKLLSVRTETIGSWIKAGYLEATPFQYGGKETYIVSDDQLRKFLKSFSGDLMPRRLPEKRLEFLSNFLFEGGHAELGLLRTRESKKEGEAFRNGEYLAASRPHAQREDAKQI